MEQRLSKHPLDGTLSPGDAGYPEELTAIPSPARTLYIQGEIPAGPRVAVVGARKSDPYGLEVARELGLGLARAGVVLVSGGAAGVDTAALRGCLDGGGRTVAVLGTGLDMSYPAANRGLFAEIGQGGALLSEYAPGTRTQRSHFPKRNRLVSGLSLGVVVVRAEKASGSLITAQHARRQGRVVMAVPGPVGQSLSQGPHELIAQGALLVEDVSSVLNALGLAQGSQGRLDLRRQESAPQSPPCATELVPLPDDLNAQERLLLEAMSKDAAGIDILVRACGLPAGEVSALLLALELRGLVAQHPGMEYSRAVCA